LRAKNDLRIDASISDGFFQFGNYLDYTVGGSGNLAYDSYFEQVNYYLSTSPKRGIDSSNTNEINLWYFYNLNGYKTAPTAPYGKTRSGTGQDLAFNPNSPSPASSDLSAADLFPNSLRVCVSRCGSDTAADVVGWIDKPGSWSYVLTAGADTASANPTSVRPLAAVVASGGDVIVDKHTSYNQYYIGGA
ncbi:hypothetical protein, partial [Rhodoplanes sp. SY1]|uniref:hypothetical protein n=1 Tax=Rhodoplanes sp. SY1 TaxID=3166646 RepID=UPI0038B451FF